MANEHLVADIPVKAWARVNNKILLVQEPDGQWALAGGRMDVGELPQDTLVRELKEEIGLDVTVGQILDCNIFTSKSGMHHFIVVFAVTVDPSQEIRVDEKEVKHVEWVEIDEVKKLRLRAEYVPIVERLTA